MRLYSITFFVVLIAFILGIVKGLKEPYNGGGESGTTEIVHVISGSENETTEPDPEETTASVQTVSGDIQGIQFNYDSIPEFSGEAYYIVNDNIPFFEPDEITVSVFENYSELDSLGRCGTAYANICQELMPSDAREEIGSVKPSGWTYSGKSNNNKYDFVDGQYIYNRCHLIGFQLAGENANNRNLITGTRYLNVTGMLPFENMVADYVNTSNNHVLYKVTPVFVGDELVCRGLLMEAYSVEDRGQGVEFCVWCYNVQPGVEINYATGQNRLEGTVTETTTVPQPSGYVVNDSSMKFHSVSCKYAQTASSNQRYVSDTREHLIEEGYVPCKVCNP